MPAAYRQRDPTKAAASQQAVAEQHRPAPERPRRRRPKATAPITPGSV